MRLFEIFGPDQGNKDERINSDIDYVSDLKFFIDNDNELVSQALFPAIKKHRKLGGDPEQYQIYIDAVKSAVPKYCEEYDLHDVRKDIFTNEVIEEVCKKFAEEQKKYIERGDYEA